MNAKELIDLLHTEDVQFSQQSVNDWAEEATTMLRQQQEKIATWEESFYNSVAENGKLRETIRQQQAEIEALKEQLRWALIAKENIGHNFNVVSLQLQQEAQEK